VYLARSELVFLGAFEDSHNQRRVRIEPPELADLIERLRSGVIEAGGFHQLFVFLPV
jgi:hypothetical protein